MDFSPGTLLRILVPRLPMILKTALLNSLNLSKSSEKQTTKIAVLVAICRSMVNIRQPLSKSQKIGTKDPGVKGSMWIAKTTIPAPELDVRDAVVQAIKALGNGTETYILPDVADVGAEWTGYRDGVKKDVPQPDVSEREKYDMMLESSQSQVVILYFHGGGHVVMDPITHRDQVTGLAKETKGVCLNVRYRLAPQQPFPAALVDALIAYLSLLSPPPGSFHKPIPASNIIFAGDSAGGNLALALMETLLVIRKSIMFHGREVPVQLPAGLALNSPWCDVSCSMPSWIANQPFDFLSHPVSPGVPRDQVPDQSWPTSPPRVQFYCDGPALDHPLVSPIAASPEVWARMPPVFICTGTECLEDEIRVTARNMYLGGGTVVFVGVEGMPHTFELQMNKECHQACTKFCVDATNEAVKKSETGIWIRAFSRGVEQVPLDQITSLSQDEVMRILQEAKEGTLRKEKQLVERWSGREKARL